MTHSAHVDQLHAAARDALRPFVDLAGEWYDRSEAGLNPLTTVSYALGTHLTAVLDPERAIALLVVACMEIARPQLDLSDL